jgi:hypothetical protein
MKQLNVKLSVSFRLIELLGAFEKLRKATFSLVISTSLHVRPSICRFERNNLLPGAVLHEILYYEELFNPVVKIQVLLKTLKRVTDNLREDLRPFMITCR